MKTEDELSKQKHREHNLGKNWPPAVSTGKVFKVLDIIHKFKVNKFPTSQEQQMQKLQHLKGHIFHTHIQLGDTKLFLLQFIWFVTSLLMYSRIPNYINNKP